MGVREWFLNSAERSNPATVLDRRHPGGLAFTAGNDVTALVHGKVYFAELLRCVQAMTAGDLLLFTDWRGDPDQLLDPERALAALAESARELQRWHDAGQAGPRPPGRLRPYRATGQSLRTRIWATPLYRTVYDPDARPRPLRRSHRF